MIEDIGAFAAILNSFISLVNMIILVATAVSLKNGINIIHKQSNSMKDELVSEVRTASIAKGILQEKSREKSDG